MNRTDIVAFLHSLQLDAVGIVPADVPLPPPSYTTSPLCPLAAGTGRERYEPCRLLPSCQSIIVILFPYYTGPEHGNLSRYSRSRDYHTIVQNYLQRIEDFLHHHEGTCETLPIIDTSVLDDRWLAYQGGLGFFGDNHCFINDRYGSYCFIGSILTSLPLEADESLTKECHHCGRCAAACPGHCFHDGIYDYQYCKSFLTQKKGSITLPEIEVIQKTPLIWGCDVCQDVCHHNQGIAQTPLPEFYEDRLVSLRTEDIESLSNKQFQRTFGTRAFAWRGKKILLRNLAYMEDLQPRNPRDDGHGNVNKEEHNTARNDDNGQNNR